MGGPRVAARPALVVRVAAPPFESFVAGVAQHDRGYGELDTDSIGGIMAPERWVEIQLRGAEPRGDDPVVDLVTVLHIHRLMTPPENEVEAAARNGVGFELDGHGAVVLDPWPLAVQRLVGFATRTAPTGIRSGLRRCSSRSTSTPSRTSGVA